MIDISDSGHIAGAEWNEGVLVVRFRDGSEYEYYDVPVGILNELLGAPSKSAMFRSAIKGQFEYSRRG